jgi:heptosyltransferase-2
VAENFKRIVVLAPNWLGDAVMARPAIADLRRHAPDAVLAVAARAPLAPLCRLVAGVDEVVALGSGGAVLGLGGWRTDAGTLARGAFDVAILLPNSCHSAWIARMAGIPERWGYRADFRRALLTRAIKRPPGGRHQAEYYQALTAALGIPPGPLRPRLEASADARARARALLEQSGWRSGAPLIGMAPGAAYGHAKQWPAARYADTIAILSRETDASFVLVGSSADRDAGMEVESRLYRSVPAPRDGRVLNLIGATDLVELVGVMAHCRAFVSNDSGAMHLAAALGLRVVAIFGPTDERATAPLPAGAHTVLTHAVWCRPCMLRECPIDHRCMTGIDARRVADAVRLPLGAEKIA